MLLTGSVMKRQFVSRFKLRGSCVELEPSLEHLENASSLWAQEILGVIRRGEKVF